MDELLRPEDRAIDVGLGGEVDDRLATCRGAGDGLGVGDVTLEELVLDPLEVRRVPGVGQLVENRNLGALPGQPAYEVGADEAGPSGNEDAHRNRVPAVSPPPGRFRHHRQVRRPRPPKRSTVIVWIVVLLLALAGTVAYVLIKLDVFAPSLSEQVSSIQKADGSWWLGMTFEGLPITMAEPSGGDRVNDIGYGACERFGSKLDPFASTRCGYPLILQVRKRRYDISLDELPKQLDGNCARRRSAARRSWSRPAGPFSTPRTWRSRPSAGPTRSAGRWPASGRSTALPRSSRLRPEWTRSTTASSSRIRSHRSRSASPGSRSSRGSRSSGSASGMRAGA